MIRVSTKLKVNDNSGAKIAQCIKVLNKSPLNYSKIGQEIVVSIKRHVTKGKPKVKKGEVRRALILHTKIKHIRPDGTNLRFDANQVALLGSDQKPISSRVFGTIPIEIINKNLFNIASISSSHI